MYNYIGLPIVTVGATSMILFENIIKFDIFLSRLMQENVCLSDSDVDSSIQIEHGQRVNYTIQTFLFKTCIFNQC